MCVLILDSWICFTMRALKSKDIYGNWGTLLLPVNKDDSIDYVRLEEEIEVLIAMQMNGIYSNGTAGEFYNQTETEFDRVSLLLAEKCERARVPFQIGCAHSSPVTSLERLKRAVALKPGAVQVILPDWMPPSMEEVIAYLQVMTEAADPVGLVLYNPPHAKKRLSPEDFYRIGEAGIHLAGCKVGGGDVNWYAAMKRLVPELSLFIPGHQLATGISLGAHGAYSNVACLHPGAAQRWYESMLTDIEAALRQEVRIQQFMQECIVPYLNAGYSNQAVDKFMAGIGNWAPVGTRLRWPYRSIPEGEIDHARATCLKLLPEFCSCA